MLQDYMSSCWFIKFETMINSVRPDEILQQMRVREVENVFTFVLKSKSPR